MNMPARYPERIVCLTEETTETLYLLGEERRIFQIAAENTGNGETVTAWGFLRQITGSTGPTRKTQDVVPVSARAVSMAKAQ